jgi:hypothetical protein
VEFSKSGQIDKNVNIKINEVEVINQGSAKFLGIWFDNIIIEPNNNLKFCRLM